MTEGADLTLQHASALLIAQLLEAFRAFLDASVVVEQEVVLTHSAVLSRIHTLGAAWGAFSADSVLGEGNPYLGCSYWALSHALLLCLEHLEIRLALSANRGVERIAGSASLVTDFASSGLPFGCDSGKVSHRDLGWAKADARVSVIVQEVIAVATGAKEWRVITITGLADRVAGHADTLVLYGDVPRARLVALILEEVALWHLLIAACAVRQTAKACLAR